ncbi:MAG: metallophosphoesterase [Vicinamibacterales bacterium]
MKLWATADLHVARAENRRAVEALEPHPGDWLIIAGDTGETPAHLAWVLETLAPRFARIVWTPGNHDLWTPRDAPVGERGVARYEALLAVCRQHDVLTPEDPYVRWPGDERFVIAPTFVLYDYSFRPDHVPRDEALAWAAETGIRCRDEDLLAPDPYPTRDAWCDARVADTEARLAAIEPGARIVLVNHYPLRRDLAVLPRIPRFVLWCGTRATEQWHRRFPLEVVVSGHLHLRSSRVLDGVRFEEVSLGYPRQWQAARGLKPYLREILSSPS